VRRRWWCRLAAGALNDPKLIVRWEQAAEMAGRADRTSRMVAFGGLLTMQARCGEVGQGRK
jgi:hypothetical protein